MVRLVELGAEVERAACGEQIDRHHHKTPYAALVLRGAYVEAGDRGRIHAEAGDVLFHDAFDGHFDSIAACGADILNLPLAVAPDYAVGRCADPDSVARLTLEDPVAAAIALIEASSALSSPPCDWPDMLAAELRTTRPIRLDRWAAEHGLRPSSLSRGFLAAYGVTPKRYRIEQRASAAARAIRTGAKLSDTAFAMGFADQPHMTRTLSSLFGRSPLQLRT